MARIMIVDDERSMREFLEIMLSRAKHQIFQADDAHEAIAWLGQNDVDLVITDLRLPLGSGMDVLGHVKKNRPETQVIVMTAFASTENAIAAMRLGAYDYLIKPFKIDEVSVVIERALERQRLERENVELKTRLAGRAAAGRLLGQSEAMRQVYELVDKVAATRTTVLLSGESGTGKELVARAIHLRSDRNDAHFVPVHCGAIPDQLLESELFGHVKGAFTGANVNKPGLFEIAQGGTLFLDEIVEMPLALQVKLLRVLQERNLRRVGGVEDISVDVRIIAASNRSLADAVSTGDFREDLYYRLNVIQISLPTLSQRRADIPLLAEAFLHRFMEEQGRELKGFSAAAIETLMAHSWHGNVRELENVVERAVTLAETDIIGVDDFPSTVVRSGEPKSEPLISRQAEQDFPESGVQLDDILERFEREWILSALKRCHGVRTRAAQMLGISFRSLRYRMAKLGIIVDEEMRD